MSIFKNLWCRSRDLNPRPSDYKSDALPAELDRQRNAYNIWNNNFFQVKNDKKLAFIKNRLKIYTNM